MPLHILHNQLLATVLCINVMVGLHGENARSCSQMWIANAGRWAGVDDFLKTPTYRSGKLEVLEQPPPADSAAESVRGPWSSSVFR
jgi:hypothetical protein